MTMSNNVLNNNKNAMLTSLVDFVIDQTDQDRNCYNIAFVGKFINALAH